MLKYRDAFYDIADPASAKNFLPTYLFYQYTHEKRGEWVFTSTHDLKDKEICKHSHLVFKNPFQEQYSDTWANSQERIGPFYIDFDCKENPAKAISELQHLAKSLLELGVDPAGVHCFASGSKGAYLFLDSRLFGETYMAGHTNLTHIQGLIAKRLMSSYSTVDYSVYGAMKKGRLVRTSNIQRDNGRYRAKISTIDFTKLSTEEILARTNAPGESIVYPQNLEVSTYLENLYKEALEEFKLTPSVHAKARIENGDIHPDKPRCLTAFDAMEYLNGNPDFRFNDWSYLVSSLVSEDQDPIASVRKYLENAPSQTYSTLDEKTKHFYEQLEDVRSSVSSTPYCDALRRNLPSAPCEGCKYFQKHIHDMGQSFVMENNGFYKKSNSRDQEKSHIISNAAALLESKQTIYDLSRHIQNLNYSFRIYVDGIAFTYSISNTDLQDNEKIVMDLTRLSDGRIRFNPNEKKPAALLLQVARANSPMKSAPPIYTKVGFVNENKYVFTNATVEDGKITFFDRSSLDAPLNSKIHNYFWRDISKERLSFVLKEYFKNLFLIHSQDVVLPTISFALTPFTNYLTGHKKRSYLQIRGLTGDSKTTLAIAVLSFWGCFSGPDSFLTAASTANSIQAEAASFGAVLILIDDIKLGHIPNVAELKKVFQNYADCVGKGRLNSNATSNNTAAIDGSLMTTGEDDIFGNEASQKGRGLELPIENCKKNFDAVMNLTKYASEINGILPHFMAYLQRLELNLLKSDFVEKMKFFEQQITVGENKERIQTTLAIQEVSFNHFMNWAESELNWSKEATDEYREQHVKALISKGKQQALESQKTLCSLQFLDELKGLIASERARIKVPGYHSDITQSERGTTIGELFADHEATGHIYLIPGISIQLVKEAVEKQGSSFPFSLKAVAQGLKRLNLLKVHDQDKLTKRRRSNNGNSFGAMGTNHEYWVVSKEALGIDTTIDIERLAKPSVTKKTPDSKII